MRVFDNATQPEKPHWESFIKCKRRALFHKGLIIIIFINGAGGRGGGHQLAAPRARRMSRPAPTLEGGALPIMAYTGKLGRIEYLFHASGI